MGTVAGLDVAGPGTGFGSPVDEGDSVSGPPPTPDQMGDGASRGANRLTIGAIVALTVVGAVIRAKDFTSLGLFRDDAWVALSSRVGLGTAWRMWVTAPGFGFVERTLMVIGPSATWWYQLPTYVCGVVAVPAMFVLARFFRLGRIVALALAVAVCVSPVCVVYSTRVKEYQVDFLLSCLLFALAEWARRRPQRQPLLSLAGASVAAFFVSASQGLVIVALWAVLVAFTLQDPAARRRVLAAGAATAVACATIFAVFYSHVSPALTRFWSEDAGFVVRSSPGAFIASVDTSAWHLVSRLFDFPSFTPLPLRLFVVAGCVAFAVVALRRDRALFGPALVVVLAFAASAAHIAPLGTGRTDEYLYPALLLVFGAGAARTLGPACAFISRVWRPATLVAGAMALLATAALAFHAYRVTPSYPGADVTTLAAELARVEQPGDHVFVDEVTRYQWGFYESAPLRLRFGSDWSTGFTVVSTDHRVFIVPSEDYEGGARPNEWAREMGAYHRLWFVGLPPVSRYAASYSALLRRGWRPVRTITAPGCSATLLERSAAGSPSST